ncbi:MAG: hypothetical protein JXR83_13510 [Deltaproteobacteria bacterium]|nr:hypothetical protein [Deltaproteobacteria bacterium]
MPQRVRQMEAVLEELRHNFDRALDLDVREVRARLGRVESENALLRAEVADLRRACDLLRRIASEHEARLVQLEQL